MPALWLAGSVGKRRMSLSLWVQLTDIVAGGQSESPCPRHAAPCVGAQVALPRCPILRTGLVSLHDPIHIAHNSFNEAPITLNH